MGKTKHEMAGGFRRQADPNGWLTGICLTLTPRRRRTEGACDRARAFRRPTGTRIPHLDSEDDPMQKTSTRRQFLAAASAGAALTFTATSYGKIVGANERISIGLIGCGGRG